MTEEVKTCGGVAVVMGATSDVGEACVQRARFRQGAGDCARSHRSAHRRSIAGLFGA